MFIIWRIVQGTYMGGLAVWARQPNHRPAPKTCFCNFPCECSYVYLIAGRTFSVRSVVIEGHEPFCRCNSIKKRPFDWTMEAFMDRALYLQVHHRDAWVLREKWNCTWNCANNVHWYELKIECSRTNFYLNRIFQGR